MYPSVFDFKLETILLNAENFHWLGGFKCDNDEMDRYVKEVALDDVSDGKGVTYLVISNKDKKLVAYYTLVSTALLYLKEQDILNKNNIEEIRISGISSIEIKMFAVSAIYQNYFCSNNNGKTIVLSDFILGDLIGEIYNISLYKLGFETIVLHSTPDAVKFYERNSFIHLDKYYSLYDDYTEGCKPMYMELFS